MGAVQLLWPAPRPCVQPQRPDLVEKAIVSTKALSSHEAPLGLVFYTFWSAIWNAGSLRSFSPMASVTAPMGDDEAATLTAVTALRSSIIDPAVEPDDRGRKLMADKRDRHPPPTLRNETRYRSRDKAPASHAFNKTRIVA